MKALKLSILAIGLAVSLWSVSILVDSKPVHAATCTGYLYTTRCHIQCGLSAAQHQNCGNGIPKYDCNQNFLEVYANGQKVVGYAGWIMTCTPDAWGYCSSTCS
jgi:hypothetical protein